MVLCRVGSQDTQRDQASFVDGLSSTMKSVFQVKYSPLVMEARPLAVSSDDITTAAAPPPPPPFPQKAAQYKPFEVDISFCATEIMTTSLPIGLLTSYLPILMSFASYIATRYSLHSRSM